MASSILRSSKQLAYLFSLAKRQCATWFRSASLVGCLATICILAMPPNLYSQKYQRSANLRYLNQLVNKVKPALKRYVTTANLQETVVFTSLGSINADISASEKNYLTTLLERTQFNGYDFNIIPSLAAFNKTEIIGDRYRLNFQTGIEESSRYSKELDSAYFMHINITYRARIISMEVTLYANGNNLRVWNETVSIFFEKRIVNYELGLLQSVGFDYSIYLSNILYIDLAAYFKIGLYIALGFSFLNLNDDPNDASKFRYIFGIKLATSLLRSTTKEYNGFDILFVNKLGVNGAIPISGAVMSRYNIDLLITTIGFSFFIRGRVSIDLEFDLAPLILSAADPAVPSSAAIRSFIEISYHF